MNPQGLEPRRRAAVDIKLLRLELVPRGRTPCEQISHEWSPAQPTENLSPEAAAAVLKVEIWAPRSVVKERYKKLQLRYPPEQFPERHIHLRPAFELLSEPVVRLNWYWQSGLIPNMDSALSPAESRLWNYENAPKPITPEDALGALVAALD
jgi:hypothetical protein